MVIKSWFVPTTAVLGKTIKVDESSRVKEEKEQKIVLLLGDLEAKARKSHG